uniref:Amino acid transporter n=1 Tax=Haemonchus contortus TaxID=6289 RepID=W6NCU5_HAECO
MYKEAGEVPWVRRNLFLVCTLSSVVVGTLGGSLLRLLSLDDDVIAMIGLPGELFMNMLRAMILPLIVASLVSGVSMLDSRTAGKLSTRSFFYYGGATIHAVLLGIVIATLIHPGDPTIKEGLKAKGTETSQGRIIDKVGDVLRNMFTENLVRSMFQQQQTILKLVESNETVEATRALIWTDGMNVIGITVFSTALGVVISACGCEARPLAELFKALDVVITRFMAAIMWLGPIGIPSLIAQKMLHVKDLVGTFRMLGCFIFTVILGLSIVSLVTLPLTYAAVTRRNPYKFMRELSRALLQGIATSSSAASLPVTFECVRDLNLDPRVAKFVLTVGTILATIGTALFQAVSPIFIAQMNDITLDLGQYVTLCVTACLASAGAATVPSSALVTMIIVLSALGLPIDDISLIFTVDWLLDRFRTCTNIVAASLGCGIVDHLSKDDLSNLDAVAETVSAASIDVYMPPSGKALDP